MTMLTQTPTWFDRYLQRASSLAAQGTLVVCLMVGLGACSKDKIPNTDVPDSPENREVLDFMERYRRAVEKRDVNALLAMASPSYFDDHGTPSGADDTDFERLKEQLRKWKELILSVRYEIRYRDIRFVQNKVFVAFTFTGSFELAKPKEPGEWARRIGDHRMELIRTTSGGFKIMSGM